MKKIQQSTNCTPLGLIALFLFFFIASVAYSQNDDSQNIPDTRISPTGSNFVHSENSVFISPINPSIILNSNNAQSFPAVTNQGLSAQSSSDGGATWPGIQWQLNTSRADPAAVIGLNGKMYIGYVNQDGDQRISISFDGGATWPVEKVIAYNNGDFAGNQELLDKNHLWIDNRNYKQDGTPNSLFKGHLYAGWTNLSNDGNNDWNTFVSVSTDDGNTWEPDPFVPQTPVSATQNPQPTFANQGVNIQTGPNGEVYACWAIVDYFTPCPFCPPTPNESGIGFSKSLTGGYTMSDWSTATKIKTVNGTRAIPLFCGNMRHNSFPSMTVNQQNGNIYIVWTEQVAADDQDIYMIRSTDGGTTWNSSTPIRVNQFTTNDQFFPWIACDEVSGALAVIYYDSRNSTGFGGSCLQTFVSISTDDGNSWHDYRISGTPSNGLAWDGNSISGNPGDFYAGDYLGIDVSHGIVVPVWSDKRTTMAAYTQPFNVPCPQNLSLIHDDYYITDETNITYDAAYSAGSSIYVKGSGANQTYKIYSGASVLMTAGDEVVLDYGFVSEGEFYAYTGSCTNFSQRVNGEMPSIQVPDASPISNASPVNSPSVVQVANPHVQVFPNPSANGKIRTYVPLTSEERESEEPVSTIFIFNIMGETVYQSIIENKIVDIDLSSQPAGVYIIKLVKGDRVYNGKVIVQ